MRVRYSDSLGWDDLSTSYAMYQALHLGKPSWPHPSITFTVTSVEIETSLLGVAVLDLYIFLIRDIDRSLGYYETTTGSSSGQLRGFRGQRRNSNPRRSLGKIILSEIPSPLRFDILGQASSGVFQLVTKSFHVRGTKDAK